MRPWVRMGVRVCLYVFLCVCHIFILFFILQEEIKRLSKENDRIRLEINKLKTDLKLCETQNGGLYKMYSLMFAIHDGLVMIINTPEVLLSKLD